MKRILTVAGSDSGGGAGIQADIKTITVLGGYGLSVITALTAQNTLGVQGIQDVPSDFIRKQMDSVLSDIGADAVKTGMLATRAIVLTVAEGLAAHKVVNLVVDPVMVATSGDPLLTGDAVDAVKEKLIPLAFMVTPNLHEASLLSGLTIEDLEGVREAARRIMDLGPGHVLIKGGHLEGEAADTLYDGRNFETFRTPTIASANTHGTGCTLSAALATFLAQGLSASEAVAAAKKFITAAIKGSFPLGAGHGPTNPYVFIQKLKDKETVLADLRGGHVPAAAGAPGTPRPGNSLQSGLRPDRRRGLHRSGRHSRPDLPGGRPPGFPGRTGLRGLPARGQGDYGGQPARFLDQIGHQPSLFP